MFREANDTLHTFNEFSAKRFLQLQKQFESHTRMLLGMKGDLDSIFRRIRFAYLYVCLRSGS